jgi:hypothetical protein
MFWIVANFWRRVVVVDGILGCHVEMIDMLST